MNDTKKFVLPALPYNPNDLSPTISSQTVDLHYGKHHQAYFNMLNTFAEGTAVRIPNKDALELIYKNVSDVVEINEDNIKSSIKNIYDDTGNISEGSGALSYAAAFKDRKKNKNKNIGIILTGGNIDRKLYSKILSK